MTRGTGRTTKMLMEAIEMARHAGKSVVVHMPNAHRCRLALKYVEEIAPEVEISCMCASFPARYNGSTGKIQFACPDAIDVRGRRIDHTFTDHTRWQDAYMERKAPRDIQANYAVDEIYDSHWDVGSSESDNW